MRRSRMRFQSAMSNAPVSDAISAWKNGSQHLGHLRTLRDAFRDGVPRRFGRPEIDAATRVFEIPGANFSAYRWGNTVEPITPGLTDRPYLAREVLPYGSPQTVNLLDALDRRYLNMIAQNFGGGPVEIGRAHV